MVNNNEIPHIIKSYLDEQELSYREFADQVSAQLGIPDAISHQTAQYWVTGIYKPRPAMMALWYQQAHGPIKELALAVLKVLRPTDYEMQS